jgi:hypothetical protein
MTTARKSGSIVALALFAAGIAGAWFVYQGLETPSDARRFVAVAGKQPAGADALPAEQEFKLPPLRAFEATLQRPVFSPSRRPIAGAPVVLSQDLAIKLQGTTGVDAEKRALLVPEGGGEALQLREGEEYQGWTLSEVGGQHVIFRREEEEVRLDVDFKEVPAPVRRRPARTGVRQPAGAQGAQGKAQQTRQNQLERQQQREQQLQQLRQKRQQQQQRQQQQNQQNQ